MPEKIEITAEEYEEYKRLQKFENEISDEYYHLYMQVLHMKLLVFAYAENDSGGTYNSKDIFELIFDLCEDMYPRALEIQNLIHKCLRGDL